MYCLEGKEGSRSQGKGESQKAEDSREEEEEINRVPLATLGQDTSRGCHPLGGHRRLPDQCKEIASGDEEK